MGTDRPRPPVKLLGRKMRRDARARRGQFAAVIVTVFLGMALFALSYDAYANLKASYQRVFDITHFADFTASGGDTQAILAAGRAVPGVATVGERRVADVPVRVDGRKLLGRVVGLPVAGQPPIDGVMVLDGSYLSASRPAGVLVEKHMAEHFGLRPGATLEVLGASGWRRVTVVGEAASAEYLWPARSRQEVLVSADDFGVLFVPEPLLGDLAASAVTRQALFVYAPGADRASIDSRLRTIARRFDAGDAFTQAEQPSNAALHEDINGFGEMAIMFPVLFLGAAALATYVMLTRLVLSQRPQIGLLLANGFGRRTLFGHYLSFGLAATLLGAIPGLIAGIVLARFVTRLYTDAVSVPIHVIQLHPLTVVVGLVFALAAGALSTLAPAIRAARLTPASAMRGPLGSGQGGRSLAERVVPPLNGLPTRWKMVLRGIGRNRRRSLSTILGIVLAATLILSSWGMLDTTNLLLRRQFVDVQRQDAEVYLATGATGEAAGPATVSRAVAALTAVPGVASAEPVVDVPASLSSASGIYQTSIQAFRPDTRMHGFYGPHGSRMALPRSGVLLGKSLRDLLDVSVGDPVSIRLPSLGATLRERVAGFVDEPMGTFAYLSLPALTEALGPGAPDPANAAMISFTPGVDAAVVRSRLAALPQAGAVIDSRALHATAQSFMGLFDVFVGLMVVLGAVMALALIYTTMSANISERLVEMASLRAAGMGRRQLAQLVSSENVLLTLIGIVPGLIVAYFAAQGFMASFSSDLFSFDLALRPWTPVLVALALLAAAALSQWPVLRAVDRIDVAVVVRERSV
jgi:putative ABC transport system permease protein